MTIQPIKNMMVLMTMGALMFLRFMDLAVFDAEHAHLERPHVQAHASEMIHDHEPDEVTEHDTLEAQAAHVGFHTLLGVFIETVDAAIAMPNHFSPSFGFHAKDDALAFAQRPPIPPPLV